jgi:hypothetical protein
MEKPGTVFWDGWYTPVVLWLERIDSYAWPLYYRAKMQRVLRIPTQIPMSCRAYAAYLYGDGYV